MPYPAQTDRESIIKMARDTIEQEGIEELSLARLASKLGIKPPSLYRHVPNKAELIQAVITFTFEQLFQSYEAAIQASGGDEKEQLRVIFRTHRSFAHTS
jgi:AcrR family transcriptional regulator